jgi:hypothetical protein
MFVAATSQAHEYRGTGRHHYGSTSYAKFNHGNRHDGYGYYGGHGYYGRGYGYKGDAALITGILVGGFIINNMISHASVAPQEETTCRKSTTTTWENGQRVGTTTTENCEGYRNTTRY